MSNYNAHIFSLLIRLISNHIYNNRSKLNFFSICKIAYDVGKNQYLVQAVKIYDVDKIKKQFTNINFVYLELPKFISFDSEPFNNILTLTVINPVTTRGTHFAKIKKLPPKLKILNVADYYFKLDINIVLPRTLETIYYINDDLSLSVPLINLKKLTVCGNIFRNLTNITSLLPNLSYLKIVNSVNINEIYHINKNNNLRTLIFVCDEDQHGSKYEYSTFTEIFNPGVKYLSLGSVFDSFSNDKLREIIPKNITHLGIHAESNVDILSEYTLLTKLTLLNSKFIRSNYTKKIPPNITSIRINFGRSRITDWILEKIMPALPNTVTSLSIKEDFDPSSLCFFPKNITRLKIHRLSYCVLPQTINELYIGNIYYDGVMINLSPNITKLSIKRNDRHRFTFGTDCVVTYRYE